MPFKFCSVTLNSINTFSVETMIMSLIGPSDSEIQMKTLDSEIKLPSSLFISGITLVIDRPLECEEIETGTS